MEKNWNVKKRLRSAGLIISKGQTSFGSFEHMQEYSGKVFLILQLKCEEAAKMAGGALGDVDDVVLFTRNWRSAGRSRGCLKKRVV